jgi:hypothetical protein
LLEVAVAAAEVNVPLTVVVSSDVTVVVAIVKLAPVTNSDCDQLFAMILKTTDSRLLLLSARTAWGVEWSRPL